jgi:hypothetical protein
MVRNTQRGLLLGCVIVSVIGIVAWRVFRARPPEESAAWQRQASSVAIEGTATPAVAGADLPFRGPAPAGPGEGREHPHPLTPQHLRIRRENQLIGAMNDATGLSDGPRLHALLDTYRAEYPDDPNRLQAGYQVIADCLEHPGAESRDAATRYYDGHRESILRRFVGRHCLDL